MSAPEDISDDNLAQVDGRRVRGLRRRDAVLAAARTLFIRHGYRGTTLEAIIALSGGSRETIYGSLGGKRGLVRAIIEEVGEKLAVKMGDPKLLNMPPEEALQRFAHQLLDVWYSDEGLAMQRMVVSEGLHAPELVDAWFQGGPLPSIRALAAYFDAQNRAKQLDVSDTHLAARQFLTLLMGEAAYPYLSGSHDTLFSYRAVDATVSMFLRAYRANKAPKASTRDQRSY